jgi:hypothetical protein
MKHRLKVYIKIIYNSTRKFRRGLVNDNGMIPFGVLDYFLYSFKTKHIYIYIYIYILDRRNSIWVIFCITLSHEPFRKVTAAEALILDSEVGLETLHLLWSLWFGLEYNK